MTEDHLTNFAQASEVTMQTYRRIAASYAQNHQVNTLPLFWQENIQRFVECVQNSPAWQANPTLPKLKNSDCEPA